MKYWWLSDAGVLYRSRFHRTAETSIGEPSENLTPGRSVIVSTLLPSL